MATVKVTFAYNLRNHKERNNNPKNNKRKHKKNSRSQRTKLKSNQKRNNHKVKNRTLNFKIKLMAYLVWDSADKNASKH